MQETWAQSLGWGDPLEKGKATHSSVLAWRITGTLWSMGSQRVRHDRATFTSLHEHDGIIFLWQLICHLHCVSFDLKLSLGGPWPQQLPLGGSTGLGNGFRAGVRPAWMDHASSETSTQGSCPNFFLFFKKDSIYFHTKILFFILTCLEKKIFFLVFLSKSQPITIMPKKKEKRNMPQGHLSVALDSFLFLSLVSHIDV